MLKIKFLVQFLSISTLIILLAFSNINQKRINKNIDDVNQKLDTISIQLDTNRIQIKKLNKQLRISENLVDIDAPKNASEYIKMYAPLAIKSDITHDIPASITLAQAIIESNSGRSQLSISKNNHFGIRLVGSTTYRNFDNVLDCFDKHSEILIKRYRGSVNDKNSYKEWALVLQKRGYAEDTLYASKLISTIHKYGLYKYDVR